jgi:hypothetical protein
MARPASDCISPRVHKQRVHFLGYHIFKPGMRMDEEREDHRFTSDAQRIHSLRGGGLLPSRLFRHKKLLQSAPRSPVIKQKDLIKTIHYLHFSNAPVLVLLRDPKHEEDFIVQSYLESCTAEEILCRWPQASSLVPDDFYLQNLIVDDGLSLLLLPIHIIDRYKEGFSLEIPKEGRLLGKRCVGRHVCQGIDIVLTQNGFVARGELINFSPLALLVRVTPDTNSSLIWMNTDNPCMISFYSNERMLFSGFCRCIRQTGDLHYRELVFSPIENEIRRFQKRKTRTHRLRMTPQLYTHFAHPFINKPIRIGIQDLTFAGFAVEEKADQSLLMPGMIIPGTEILDSGTMKLTCDVQVVYRHDSPKGRVRCGLAILDMDFHSYRHLSHIMVHAGNPLSHFSSELDMDAIWKFFFDTGFIYPKKYHMLQYCREEFKETYRKLYREDQNIEAHFTYQENGQIYGHVSIFQAYQRAWMVHHLAARTLNGKHTGLTVLKNVLQFFDGLYRYPSIRMDHMLFYFRPENHFPNLFFGGFARDLRNQRACSLDLFAYMSHMTERPQNPFSRGWQLRDFETCHLPELECFYRNTSGGLLLDVLRIGQTDDGNESLREIYRRQGFLRNWHTYALLREQSLKAVLIVNRSSAGLNLSEFLNSIKIIVTDPADLPWDILINALTRLTPEFHTETVPLLIYPAHYPSDQGLKVDKHYLLWILNTQYGKEYLEYMEKKTRMTLRFLLRYLLKKLVPK